MNTKEKIQRLREGPRNENEAQHWAMPEDMTCWNCPEKDMCEFAFDLYNTDGDCLADK